MQKQRILLGLQRASWLFALVVAVIIVTSDERDTLDLWDFPGDYIAGSLIAFFVFRIGIWVFKGFAGIKPDDAKKHGNLVISLKKVIMGFTFGKFGRYTKAISACESAIAIKTCTKSA